MLGAIAYSSLEELHHALLREKAVEGFSGDCVLLDQCVVGSPSVRATRSMLGELEARMGTAPRPRSIVAFVPDVGAAMTALQEGASDCLLPNDPPGRWLLALGTVVRSRPASERTPKGLAAGQGDALVVRQHRRVIRVPVLTISAVCASENYVELIGPGRRHLLRGTLQIFAERLARYGFMRVHRCTLVQSGLVRCCERKRTGAMYVVLSCGARYRVSRRYQRAVLEALGQPLTVDRAN